MAMTAEKPSYEYLLMQCGSLETEMLGLNKMIDELVNENEHLYTVINTKNIELKKIEVN